MSGTVVVVLAGATGLLVLLTLRSARRDVPIRQGLEATRIVVGAAGAVLMGTLVEVHTPVVLAGAAVAAGLGFGYLQGRQVHVVQRNGRLFARRTLVGVLLWGIGVVAMQLAGLGSRVEVFRIGQAGAFFAMSLGAGVMLGRSPAQHAARRVPAGVATLLMVALLGSLVAVPLTARAQQVDLEDLLEEGQYGAPIPAWVCEVLPLPPKTTDSDVGEQGIGECIGRDDDNVEIVHTWAFESEEAAERGYAVQFGYDPYYRTTGSVDGVGDTSFESDILAADGIENPSYIVYGRRDAVLFRADAPTRGRAIELARQIDDNILALPAGTTPGGIGEEPDGLGSDEEVSDGGGAGSTEDDGDRGGSRNEGTTTTTEPIVPIVEDRSLLEGGDIGDEEAVQSAIAGILTALAMGIITLAEAGQALTELFAATGGVDHTDALLDPFRSHAGPDDRLQSGSGGFDPLDHGSTSVFPGQPPTGPPTDFVSPGTGPPAVSDDPGGSSGGFDPISGDPPGGVTVGSESGAPQSGGDSGAATGGDHGGAGASGGDRSVPRGAGGAGPSGPGGTGPEVGGFDPVVTGPSDTSPGVGGPGDAAGAGPGPSDEGSSGAAPAGAGGFGLGGTGDGGFEPVSPGSGGGIDAGSTAMGGGGGGFDPVTPESGDGGYGPDGSAAGGGEDGLDSVTTGAGDGGFDPGGSAAGGGDDADSGGFEPVAPSRGAFEPVEGADQGESPLELSGDDFDWGSVEPRETTLEQLTGETSEGSGDHGGVGEGETGGNDDPLSPGAVYEGHPDEAVPPDLLDLTDESDWQPPPPPPPPSAG